MTNEEKAREIELDVYAFGEKPNGNFEAPAYRAALEMADWKDQQFKEYLMKKLSQEHPTWNGYECNAATTILTEIVNELFGPSIE